MQLLLLSAESTNLEVCLIHGARPRHLVGVGIQGGHQKVGETHIHRVRTLRRSPAPSWFSTHSPPSYCAVRTSAGSMQISATSAARICRLVLRGLRGAPSSTPDRAGFSRSDAARSVYGARTDPRRPPKYSPPARPPRWRGRSTLYLSNVLLGRWVDAAAYRRRNKALTAPVDVSGCERHLRKTLAFPDTDINLA